MPPVPGPRRCHRPLVLCSFFKKGTAFSLHTCVDGAARQALKLPALELGEAAVHLEQLLGERGRLVPAAAAPHLQEGVLRIPLVSASFSFVRLVIGVKPPHRTIGTNSKHVARSSICDTRV